MASTAKAVQTFGKKKACVPSFGVESVIDVGNREFRLQQQSLMQKKVVDSFGSTALPST
jgi:hypothetical protein